MTQTHITPQPADDRKGTVVVSDYPHVRIHTYVSPPDGFLVNTHIVEGEAALDTIESLHPRAVIAGHKRPGSDDSPRIIEETRQYIRAFDRVAETTTTARELYDQMLSLYPDRVNPGALWTSARALKG